ncbi:S-Ena type endospore appendage [Pontibacillus salipaludis]|uniref:S-Ena type endospore appendage n=1 Tax=Pontibacillus salipaludis TaxID=1697394 RepID=UPI0031EE8D40
MDAKKQHCLQVQQVYDWVTLPLSFRKKICLPDPQRKAMDEICGNFSELTGEFTTLWETDVANVSGTVTLSLERGSLSDITLSVNGEVVLTGSGNVFTQTFNPLSIIEVKRASSSVVEGRYCLDLEYNLGNEEQDLEWDEWQIPDTCFLSDPCGNPVSLQAAVHCREIGMRKSVPVTLPNQETVTLKQVTLLFEGYISFRTFTGRCLCVTPFYIYREILLCAPDGTTISCHTLSSECTLKPSLGDPTCIDLKLALCESIQVTTDAHILIEGEYCSPRRSDLFIEGH